MPLTDLKKLIAQKMDGIEQRKNGIGLGLKWQITGNGRISIGDSGVSHSISQHLHSQVLTTFKGNTRIEKLLQTKTEKPWLRQDDLLILDKQEWSVHVNTASGEK